MIKCKMYSIYTKDEDNYSTPNIPGVEWVKNDDEAQLLVFENFKIPEVEKIVSDKPKVAFMCEPRSMSGLNEAYEYLENNPDKFDAIFTFDSKILEFANAHLYFNTSVWGEMFPANRNALDTKLDMISMISSNKEYCELHKKRIELAKMLENNPKVRCFGTYNGGNICSTETSHRAYKFAVVIENYIDDYWFTEKICNCFANKVIPIYYGAKKISTFFNPEGIITVDNVDDILGIVYNLNISEEYEKRYDAVCDNYARVKTFSNYWELFKVMNFRVIERLVNK